MLQNIDNSILEYGNMKMETEKYKLVDIANKLGEQFPQISDLYLFGSRRFGTGSMRSDIDILVKATEHIRPNDLRIFTQLFCPALDLFIADAGKATSCANESYVQADSFDQLVSKLNAEKFWSKTGELFDIGITLEIDVPVGIDFPMTSLVSIEPFPAQWPYSMHRYAKFIEEQGLPSLPYIGHTASSIADYLITLIRLLPEIIVKFNPRGKAWKVKMDTEYDFQNLFYLIVKPWLPGLGREEVTIKYDGAEKSADFNLFRHKIVIEMKHIRDTGTKATVLKTLAGLKDFYTSHPNIDVLIFAILVNQNVEIDEAKWESDFSELTHKPSVKVVLIKNPIEES